MTTPLVTIDVVGKSIELTVWPSSDSGGLSVLLSAADWCAITAQAEQLEPVRQYRADDARRGASHHARRVP